MKNFFILCLAIILYSCQSKTEKTSEVPMTRLEPAFTDNTLEKDKNLKNLDPEVAVNFLNSYIKSSIDGEIGILEFTESNPNATEDLKSELERMLNKALEKDPIVGLGFDPFFDAQDFPMEVALADFDKESGYLQLKGLKDWEEYRVTMRLINNNGRTMVDGCGVVNIPKTKQAAR